MNRIREIFFGREVCTDILYDFDRLIYENNLIIKNKDKLLVKIKELIILFKKEEITKVKLTGDFFLYKEINEIILLFQDACIDLIFELDSKNILYFDINNIDINNLSKIELRIRFLFDFNIIIKDRRKIYQIIKKIKEYFKICNAVFTVTKLFLSEFNKELLFIDKLNIQNLIIDFPECKKGLEKYYLKMIPKVDEAQNSISFLLKLCKENKISNILNDRHYIYEMPKDLLDKYFNLNIMYEYNSNSLKNKLVSIIIPTCNKIEYLKKVLLSLKDQTIGTENYEVIVVDDGSNDGTQDFFKDLDINLLKIKYRLKYIFWPRKYELKGAGPYNRVGPVRNIGVRFSNTEYLIFVDSDIVVKDSFIKEHLKTHKDFDIVIGPSYREKEGNDAREGYFNIANDDLSKTDMILWELAHEGNISFKKKDFNLINGFSDEYIYWAYEGDDIAFNLIKNYNKKIQLNRNASGLHLNHPPEYIDKKISIHGGIYNSEIMYKKYLDKDIFERFFIYETEDLKNCNCVKDVLTNETSFNRLMTLCVETRKCEKINICKAQPIIYNVFKKLKNYNFFFRNDDVHKITKKLKRLIDLFLDYGIPINLAIIPNKIESELVSYLILLKQKYGRLVSIHQHGFNHNHNENKNWNNNAPFEFGSDQSYDYQLKLIKKGKSIMDNAFENYNIPAFTPPYHSFNNNTIKVLNDLNFKLFSADLNLKKIDLKLLKNISVNIDIVKEYYPKKISKLENEIIRELLYLIKNKTSNTIGIVLHHEKMSDYDFKVIERLIKLIKLGENKFLSFDDSFKIEYLSENLNIKYSDIYFPVNDVSDIKLDKYLDKINNHKFDLYFKYLINLLDGTNTIANVYESFLIKYNISYKSFLSLIVKLRKENIIKNVHNLKKELELKKLSELLDVIEIRLTDDCNLNCSMCVIKHHLGNKDFAYDKLCKSLTNLKHYGFKYVAFSGGEPLLYPHFKDVLMFCKKINLNVILITNGTLITQKNSEFITKHCFMVRISIDSHIEKLNNELRPPNSYSKIINAISYISEANKKIKKENRCLLSTNTVLQDKTINFLAKHIDFLESLPIDNYEFDLIIPSNKFKTFNIFLNDFFSGKNNVLLKILKSQKILGFLTDAFLLSNFINKQDYQKEVLKFTKKNNPPCLLGKLEYMNVSSDGKVYPCCYEYDNNNLNLFNLFDDNIKENLDILKNKFLNPKKSFCNGCPQVFYSNYWYKNSDNLKQKKDLICKIYCKNINFNEIIQIVKYNKKIFNHKLILYNLSPNLNKIKLNNIIKEIGFSEVFFVET